MMKHAKTTILYLTSSSAIGGAERLVLDTVARLDRNIFAPRVASLFGPGDLTERCRAIHVEAHNLNLRSLCRIGEIRKLKTLLKRIRPDIIQSCGLRADIWGRMFKKISGAKCFVSTIHNVDPWRQWYHVLLDRGTACRTDLFIAVSEAVRKTRIEREKFPPEKIRTIYNGIDARQYENLPERVTARAVFGLSESDAPVIGILANLRKQKGHLDVIDTLPSLCNQFPAIRFIFAGKDYTEGEAARRAAERGVKEHIVFPGFIDDPKHLFGAADMFLLPSYWEGMPVSVLEAMAAGVPIIATPVGGVPEIIEDGKTGLLIPPGDREALLNALATLANRPELSRTLVDNARKRVVEHFDIDIMVKRYEHEYLKLLGE